MRDLMKQQRLVLSKVSEIQLIRFLLVGFFNTALGYAIIFGCMFGAGLSPQLSNIVGYSVGLLVSYGLNKLFTFRARQRSVLEPIRFVGAFAVAFGINFAVLTLLLQIGCPIIAAQLLAGVAYILTSYLLNKLFVFKTPVARA